MLVWLFLFKIPVSETLSVHDLYLQQFVYFVSNETLNFAVNLRFTCMLNRGGQSVQITDQLRSVTPLLSIGHLHQSVRNVLTQHANSIVLLLVVALLVNAKAIFSEGPLL